METETHYTMRLLDVCLPDYFQGYADSDTGECLAVPVHSKITPKEFYDAIDDAWQQSCGALEDGDAFDAARRHFVSILSGGDGGQDYFARNLGTWNIEDCEDGCCDSVYAYIALELEV